ncbi:MAG: hypothetical protein AAFX06_15905 [Planctomycetota bacterium]
MNRQRFTICLILFGCGLLACADGPPAVCHVGPASETQLRVSRYARDLVPRRVLIVTGKNHQDRLPEQTMFAESLADHLRRSSFPVIVSRDCICEHHSPLRLGKFDEREVLRLAKQHQADTILYAEVPSIDGYAPMRVQGSVLMVNAGEAISVLSVISTVDLKRISAKTHYLAFARQGQEASFEETFLHEPATLINFTAREVCRALMQTWTDSPETTTSGRRGTLR